MKKFVWLSLILFITSCVSVKKHNQVLYKLHSINALHDDIDQVYNKLQRLHPNLYQYISKLDFDKKIEILKSEIDHPMGSQEFYERLAVVLKNIGQGHLLLKPPLQQFTKKEIKLINKKKFEFGELDFEYLDNKLWIKNTVGSDSTIVGDEVLALDKDLAPLLVEKYKKLFASDGYNTTFYNRRVGALFSYYYRLDKGFKDSVSLMLKKNDSVYFKTMRRPLKAEKDTVSKDTVATEVKPKLSKNDIAKLKLKNKVLKKEKKRRGYVTSRKYYIRNFNFIGNDNTVGYIKIRGFKGDSYKRFYQETFAKLQKQKSTNLVLDFRDNFGGSMSEILYLYRFLAKEPFVFANRAESKTRFPILKKIFSSKDVGLVGGIMRILSLPGFLTLDLIQSRKKNGTIYKAIEGTSEKKPFDTSFKGNLYVLINGNSFSASAIISANLQGSKRATFVGEETGGAYNSTVAGQSKHLRLKNSKVDLRFGMLDIGTPYKQTPNGYGVKPDVVITPTIQDRKKGIDPELQWVLQELGKK